jgi:hypothetical protein
MSTEKSLPPKSSGAARSAVPLLLPHHAFRTACGSVHEFSALLAHVTKELGETYEVDLWQRTYETLGVDDVREINERARDCVSRASEGAMSLRLVAIFASRLTDAAQNALLKTLEEPPDTTKLLLATPSPDSLLDTIISRTIFLENNTIPLTRNCVQLLQMTKAKRLEFIAKIIEEKKIAEARVLVMCLVDTVGAIPEAQMSQKKKVHLRMQLLDIDTAIRTGSPSLKMLLETAVLLVP